VAFQGTDVFGPQVNPAPGPFTLTTDFATIEFSQSKFTLNPGQSQTITAKFTPPSMDPKEYPAYSGHIEIISLSGTMRVSYMGIMGSVHEQQLLDRSDAPLGSPLPLIRRPGGGIQNTTTIYTFANGDYPTIVSRYGSLVDASNNQDTELAV
jgi:hypothetical protein